MPRVQQFESKTSPGKFYDCTLHDDGTATCDMRPGNECRGFKYSKKKPPECTHTKAMLGLSEGKAISKTLLNVNRCPVRPMLAHPQPEGSMIEDFSAATHVLEEKYNGHRRILDTEALKAWSRVGNENSIPAQISPGLRLCRRCLLDGEAYVPGGVSTDVKDLENESKLVLVVFDILQIETEPGSRQRTLALPLSTRRQLLLEAVPEEARGEFLQVAPQFPPSAEGLEAIWARGGEGAIVKRLDAPYAEGKRSKDWIKFKLAIPHAMFISGFLPGEFGPYSIIQLEDQDGTTTTVKSLNDEWRAAFAADPNRFLMQILWIEHFGRTRDGSFTSPRADHFEKEDLP